MFAYITEGSAMTHPYELNCDLKKAFISISYTSVLTDINREAPINTCNFRLAFSRQILYVPV